MKTFYFLAPMDNSYSTNPRRCFDLLSDCQKAYDEMESKGIPAKMQLFALNNNEHFWAVYIADNSFVNDYNAIYCKATSKSEARKKGNAYIRHWNLCGEKIQKISKLI